PLQWWGLKPPSDNKTPGSCKCLPGFILSHAGLTDASLSGLFHAMMLPSLRENANETTGLPR
ncbi:hypothetical protein ACRQPR_000001, partial [Citrobacter amalonaticus]